MEEALTMPTLSVWIFILWVCSFTGSLLFIIVNCADDKSKSKKEKKKSSSAVQQQPPSQPVQPAPLQTQPAAAVQPAVTQPTPVQPVPVQPAPTALAPTQSAKVKYAPEQPRPVPKQSGKDQQKKEESKANTNKTKETVNVKVQPEIAAEKKPFEENYQTIDAIHTITASPKNFPNSQQKTKSVSAEKRSAQDASKLKRIKAGEKVGALHPDYQTLANLTDKNSNLLPKDPTEKETEAKVHEIKTGKKVADDLQNTSDKLLPKHDKSAN